jgi:TldD protein
MKKVFSGALCAAALFSTMVVTKSAIGQKPSQNDDPMLKAMQTELDREKALLVLPGMQKPYFIEYRLDDVETYEAVANYGALTREEGNHQRIVRVDVRVGDYTMDNSSSRGDGSVELAPRDNNPEALRYALWTATDTAYKNALRAYSAKQAALKQFQTSRTEQDFAPANRSSTSLRWSLSISIARSGSGASSRPAACSPPIPLCEPQRNTCNTPTPTYEPSR